MGQARSSKRKTDPKPPNPMSHDNLAEDLLGGPFGPRIVYDAKGVRVSTEEPNPTDRFVGDGDDFGFGEPEELKPPDRFVSDGDDFEIVEPSEDTQPEGG